MNIKKLIVTAMTLFFVLVSLSGNSFETSVFASETSSEVQEYKVDDIITVTQKNNVDTLYEDDQITEVEASLSKIGILSVWLLPGFIIVYVFIFTLKMNNVYWATELESKDPVVVITGIVISILLNIILKKIYTFFILVFSAISSIKLVYGTNYILMAYVISLGIALMAAYVYIDHIKKINQDRTFTPNDDAMKILEKISKNQQSLNLDRVKICDTAESTEELLLLLPENSTKNSIKTPDDRRFFCPKIQITITKCNKQKDDEIKDIIRNQNDSAEKLVNFLKNKENKGLFEIKWSGDNRTKVIEMPLDKNKIVGKQNLIDY